ncbi:hypothetical protein KC19_10G127100 [Ceratodon purpureus]|uniref:Uncharacterized protein n=1 Tax=Ceratodon purpureus TaxID=3225 RepID=A0A8T0GMJ9_CERPU|nr:hypothetical protein KC19_10G127100 [Ceratodon purpureus]
MSEKKEEGKEEGKEEEQENLCKGGGCTVPKLTYPKTFNLSKKEIGKFEHKIESMLRCFIGESDTPVPKHHLMGTRVAENCTRGMKKRRYLLAAAVRAHDQQAWLKP